MDRLEQICERKYPVRIHWIDESDGRGYYFAYLPDWGYSTVSATADTEKEALEQLEIMKRNVAQYFLDTDKDIPEVSDASQAAKKKNDGR